MRGRVNHDLTCIYLPATDIQQLKLNIPDEFFGKMLFAEDREKLCTLINLQNENGRLCKWPTIKEILLEQEYQITEGRKNNRRYAVITPLLE